MLPLTFTLVLPFYVILKGEMIILHQQYLFRFTHIFNILSPHYSVFLPILVFWACSPAS